MSERSCENCDAPFEPAAFQSGRQIYCSKRCKRVKDIEAKRSGERVLWALCNGMGCGKAFRRTHAGHKFCSVDCRTRAKNSKRRVWIDPRSCRRCKEEYSPTRSTQVYCSEACKRSDHHPRYYKRKRLGWRKCNECGKRYKPSKSNQTYCGKTCRRRARMKRYLSDPANVETMKLARQRWREANPGYDARMQKIYSKRRRESAA